MRTRSQRFKRFRAYWVVGPFLLFMATFSFLPMAGTLGLSLFRASPVHLSSAQFIGLQHYKDLLLRDPDFWDALKNTVVFVLLRCGAGIPLSLLLALALSRVKHLREIYSTVIFLPVMFSTVATALVFSWLMQPQFGMVNPLLRELGILGSGDANLGLLTHASQALICLIVIETWSGVGFATIIFLNGLLGIPDTYYEAARVDGARELQMFWHVTLPLLSRTSIFVMITSVLGAFKVFEIPNILRGIHLMPGKSGKFLSINIYHGIADFQLGHACAMGVLFLALVLIITLIQLKLMATDWEY